LKISFIVFPHPSPRCIFAKILTLKPKLSRDVALISLAEQLINFDSVEPFATDHIGATQRERHKTRASNARQRRCMGCITAFRLSLKNSKVQFILN
jgi:hypothetical protein